MDITIAWSDISEGGPGHQVICFKMYPKHESFMQVLCKHFFSFLPFLLLFQNAVQNWGSLYTLACIIDMWN